MKTILLLSTLISSSAFSATLKVPLFVEDNNKIISVSTINAQYKLQGAEKLQEEFVITTDSVETAHEAYWALHSKVEATAEKLKKDFFLATDRPGGFKAGKTETCYTGSPDEAVQLAAMLSDSFYSDQLGIFGYKYKKQTTILEGQDSAETLEFLNEQSPTWKNWNSSNENILVLSHESDDGDDVNEGTLVKCK